jgi:hypothetical protein
MGTFYPYPSQLLVKVMDTGELVDCGGRTLEDATELKWVQLHLMRVGTPAGSERVRMKVFTDSALSKLYATSDWVSLAEATGSTGNWKGAVRFDFGRQHLDAGTPWHFAVEATSYARSGDTFYLGFPLDWPYPIHSQPAASLPGVAMVIMGAR